jgi:hypothetical protein
MFIELLFYFSWDLSYQIEPKETADNSQSQEQFVRTYCTQPLKAYRLFIILN